MNPYRQEQIEGFVSDFCESAAIREHGGLVREYAPEVLVAFLSAACAARDVDPAEIEEADLKPALLQGVAALEIPGSVKPGIPPLIASFLEELQAQGRLSDGGVLGAYVRVLGKQFAQPKPIVSSGAKLGRNDPCPCGSGKKYKKCCRGSLG